ncbi:MAG: YdeI/OmpD-associated family protein [Chitinophagales bacterium]|nr:YdeI/OmpD-associated family protein [Chitinophagales bacterium]
MIRFTAPILKFDKKGEKTSWTYIEIPEQLAQQLKPGNKQSFLVKGKLDSFSFKQTALLPMGSGDFILPLNVVFRKSIRKRQGAQVAVIMEIDNSPLLLSQDFMQCMEDEPNALAHFKTLPKSHQNYFSKWIESAKTEPTKAKRIAQAVSALAKKWGFTEMARAGRE